MVLLRFALSVRRLFRIIRSATRVCRRRNSSSLASMETRIMRDDDRTGVLSLSVVAMGERERGEMGEQREAVERGFMMSARMASHPTVQLSTGSRAKRKLEEFDSGVAEVSHVRARREARDEDTDGSSVAESSGRERYASGRPTPGEAQALDGESLMREEGGNEAVDADAMWEEEPGWNRDRAGLVIANCEIARVVSSEKGDVVVDDDGLCLEQNREGAGTSLSSMITPSQVVDTGGFADISVSVPGAITGESVCADAGNICRGRGDEVVVASGKDSEGVRETDFDIPRSREKEKDLSLSLSGHEEESSSRRYTHPLSAPSVANLTEFTSNSSTAGATQVGGGLSGCVSGLLAGGCGGIGNETEGSCSTSGARSVDVVSNQCRIQFFVRTYIDGRTIVLNSHGSETIESVHQQILMKTGLPTSEQRLIFRGRQLQQDQTLDECGLTNDATLFLVARMRSTALPHSWQLINDLVASVRRLCANGEQYAPLGSKLMHAQDVVRTGVHEFLKMACKAVPVSEHMQVFQLAGATSAIVMLLLSPVESNRECAEEAISIFLQAQEEYLPSNIYPHCAPVLLDFCKLLAKSAPNHCLYAGCRNSLARLLDSIGIAHGSPYFNDARAETIVQDFSPFVQELSSRISSRLRSIFGSYTDEMVSVQYQAYIKEAKDFTAFVIPLCKAMEVCKGIDSSGKSGTRHCQTKGPNEIKEVDSSGSMACEVGVEVGSHGWLRALFKEVLLEIHNGLVAVEFAAKAPAPKLETAGFMLAYAPSLVVLKGLHAVAKIYDGAMEDLIKVLRDNRTSLNVLIRQAKWNDDDYWLLEHKDLLDFESKRKLVLSMLPEPQDDHEERQEIVVHRSQLLSESFELLAYVEPEVLQGGLSVEFAAEEATGPGVLREWFSMICREIFNPQNALFLPCPNDRRRYFPNPASGVNPGHLTYFRFCGRVLALALMHRVQVDVVFALTFFKQLAGLPVSWEDAKDADPCLYESCKKILEMDAETVDADALGLTFVSEFEVLGSRKTLELCQGGKEMVVTSGNRQQFVELLVQRRLVSSVAEQIKSFTHGFSDLLTNYSHQQFFRALEPEDFDLMLYGKDRNVCIKDWKKHTEYHDFKCTDDHIKWFWQVVEEMTPEQRRRLLFFSTSVSHLPAEGFAGLSSKFHIHRAHTDASWLPTAHTCFFQLVLPAYPTLEVMRSRLHAITEVHVAEGFGFA